MTSPSLCRRYRALAALLLALAVPSAGCLTMRGAQGHSEAEVASAPAPARTRGDAPSAAETLAAAPPAAQRYAVLNRLLARSLQRAGDDCAAVAAAVEGWTTSYGAEFRELQREVDVWESRSGRYEIERYYAVVFPDVEVRIDAGIRCHEHRAARAAYDRFFAAVGFDHE